MKRILTTLALTLVVTTAFSQTQVERNKEAADKYNQANAELNKVYKELAALLSPERKALLVKAQRTWITFRDTQCRFTASSYEGGSLQPLLHAMCMRDLTEQRIMQLKVEKEGISKQ